MIACISGMGSGFETAEVFTCLPLPHFTTRIRGTRMNPKYDLTGRTFGHLTVIEYAYSKNGTRCWKCHCDCGAECVVRGEKLKNGSTKSCGHLKHTPSENKHGAWLIGQKFNRLTVLEFVGTDTSKSRIWRCRCDCGNECIVRTSRLVNSVVKSCGCLRKEVVSNKTFIDLTGQRFGRLSVTGLKGSFDNHRIWICKCDCGRMTEVPTNSLLSGNTKSCGCLRIDNARDVRKSMRTYVGEYKNGQTRIYRIWHGMCQRCYNLNSDQYKNYGARGITVCSEWRSEPLKFQDWALNNGYDDTLSIDRINPNGNYEPSNCRWVRAETQQNNRRNNVRIKLGDVEMTMAQWDRKMGYRPGTIGKRIRSGWDPERAIQTPLQKKVKS